MTYPPTGPKMTLELLRWAGSMQLLGRSKSYLVAKEESLLVRLGTKAEPTGMTVSAESKGDPAQGQKGGGEEDIPRQKGD